MQKLSTHILLCLLAASTSAPSLSAQQVPPKKEKPSYGKVMVVGLVVLVGAAGCYGLYTWRKSKGKTGEIEDTTEEMNGYTDEMDGIEMKDLSDGGNMQEEDKDADT